MQMKNKPGGMEPSQLESGTEDRSRGLNTRVLYSVLRLSFHLSF